MNEKLQPTPSILRRRQVEQRTGLSRSTIYLYMEIGAFPKPVRLGPRAVGWLESDVNAWIFGRISAGRSASTTTSSADGKRRDDERR